MSHHKRRRRKKGGVKGHCHLCSLATTDGRRNGRTLTVQEQAARVSEREQVTETPEPPELVESYYSDWTWEDDMYLHGYDWDGAPAEEWAI